MTVHLTRAELLISQSRHQDALDEAGKALAANPENPEALACIARCHAHLRQTDEALAASRNAIALAGDVSYYHKIHAYVLYQADRFPEALDAVNEAVRIEPDDESNFTLRSSINLALSRWQDALRDAESALNLNPEDIEALNHRSIALVQLGRPDEAHNTGDFTLNRAPEDGMAHAVKGWACLHQSHPDQAQTHFREALRLEPDLEYARHGMLEALKATNPVYRGMLAYFLWMGRQSKRLQWAFIIVTFFGVGFVRRYVDTNPGSGMFLWPLLGVFYAFIYLTWTAVPLFNLLLRLNRFGRHVLTAEERRNSTYFGLSLLPLFGALFFWANGAGTEGLFASIITAMLSVCVAASVVHHGKNRIIMLGATGALAATAFGILFGGQTQLLQLFFLGFIGFQLLANSLQR